MTKYLDIMWNYLHLVKNNAKLSQGNKHEAAKYHNLLKVKWHKLFI